MKILYFAFERSIVFTSFGLLVVILIKVFLGRLLVARVPNIWLRSSIYAFCGATGIIYDYNIYSADEFSNLSMMLHAIVFLTSFAWMYLLIAPIAFIFAKRKQKKAIE